jgi:site-specific recombinase XerD
MRLGTSRAPSPGIPPRSLEWREQKLSRFVAWCAEQGLRDVESVTLPIVHRFLAELPPTLSDFTRNGYARVLKAFLHYCAREDLVPERLAKRIQMPKMPQKVIEVFTPSQIKLLMAAASHEATQVLTHRDQAIMAVLLDTGIRASELCGLTIEQVQFAPGDCYVQVMGKGRKERQVGLGERSRTEVHRWLHRYRTAQPDERRVFLNRNGRPLTRHGLDQLLYRCRDFAGPQHFASVRVSAHTFRHTMACAYLEAGGDLYKLSRLLGHTSVSVTEHYLRAFSARAARQGSVCSTPSPSWPSHAIPTPSKQNSTT